LTKDHPIALTIGLNPAEKLARFVGNGQGSGGRIEVPRGVALSRARRNEAIQAELADGLSKQKIALRHKLTTRRVRQICNGARDDSQGELF
jgi:Mor family transcriptional regulator